MVGDRAKEIILMANAWDVFEEFVTLFFFFCMKACDLCCVHFCLLLVEISFKRSEL